MKKTPFERQNAEIEVLGSRFIAILDHLSSFDGGEEFLGKIKEEYPKATHYCYAYCVNGKEKCSDDGEPARSVGLPLLELLRTNDIDKAILVVVRYFGGTKLGLGRLSRTYREVGEKSLNEADFAEIIEGTEAKVTVEYALYDKVEYECRKLGIEIFDKDFGIIITLFLRGDSKIMENLLGHNELFVGIEEKKTIEIRRKI